MDSAPKLSLAPSPHGGQSSTAALDAVGDQEPPDARLVPAERRTVKQLLVFLDPLLSDEGFMFLAGGAEDVALRKRARDGRSA
jgi:hypothetical protein